jgi:hypothetical protein
MARTHLRHHSGQYLLTAANTSRVQVNMHVHLHAEAVDHLRNALIKQQPDNQDESAGRQEELDGH